MSLDNLATLLESISNEIRDEAQTQRNYDYLNGEISDAQKVIEEQNTDNLVGRQNYEQQTQNFGFAVDAARIYGARLENLGRTLGMNEYQIRQMLDLTPVEPLVTPPPMQEESWANPSGVIPGPAFQGYNEPTPDDGETFGPGSMSNLVPFRAV
jgi:hypothetical protein